MKTIQSHPDRATPDSDELGDAILRYLDGERAYHADVLDLVSRLGAGRLTAEHQSRIDDLRSRRHALLNDRNEMLAVGGRHAGNSTGLSDLVRLLHINRQRPLLARIQEVRSLVIHTRIAAERLDRRLTMMHDCLEEILTGQPAVKAMSYDRSGRLNSLPSNRSLLTSRG